jgi:hypothetical protein
MSTVTQGIFGGNTDEEDRKAKEYADKALAEMAGLEAPELSEIDLEKYTWNGDYKPTSQVTPTMIDAGDDVEYDQVLTTKADQERVGETALRDISVDPRLKESQIDSLGALQEIAAGGGFTAADEANLSRIQNDNSTADRGRRDSILQNMQQRGMGGSGLELLAQLQSSQAATDRNAQQGLDVAGMAQQRALDAIIKGGGIAGDIRSQDFGEQERVAQARDEISKFNASNTNNMNQWNAGQANSMGLANAEGKFKAGTFNSGKALDAKKFNAGNQFEASKINTGYANDASKSSWEGRQATSNSNTGIQNTQTMHNKYTIPQATLDNKTSVAQSKATAAKNMQDYYSKMGDREAAEGANNMSSAVKIGATAAMLSDEREKKNIKGISSDEIEDFLSSLAPKTYKYKDAGNGKGERVGVMAQDLEKSKLGSKAVFEDEDGKKNVDTNNLLGLIMASLAHKGKK